MGLRRALVPFFATLTLAACGGSAAGDGPTPPTSNPVPVITAASPARIDPGSGPTTVTLTGTGFIASSRAQWAGRDWPTHFFDAKTLTFDLPASELAGLISRANVTVTNDAPGGGISAPISIFVQRAAPVISSITPSSLIAGDTAFKGIITVTGQNFTQLSRVIFGNTGAHVISASATQIVVDAGSILALRRPGVVQVLVNNSDPTTPQSDRVDLTVSYPVPVITRLSPDSALAGAAFALTVTGSGIYTGSVVQWNGAARPMSVDAYGNAVVSIPASDAVAASTASVTIFNPAPGGGTSNAVTFRVH